MASDLDARLSAATLELLERLEATLPPKHGALILMYNTLGRDLALTVAALNHEEGDTLKVLDAARRTLVKRLSDVVERWYEHADGMQSQALVTSAAVTTFGAHERVRVWNRGGLAGELVVNAGDGARIAALLELGEKP